MKPPNFFLKKYHFHLHFVINSLFSHTLFYNLTEKGDSFTQTAAHLSILAFYLQFITQSKSNQALLKYLAKAGIRNICFRNTYRKFIGITEERTLISGSLASDQMNILETRRFNLLVIGSRSRGRQ